MLEIRPVVSKIEREMVEEARLMREAKRAAQEMPEKKEETPVSQPALEDGEWRDLYMSWHCT